MKVKSCVQQGLGFFSCCDRVHLFAVAQYSYFLVLGPGSQEECREQSNKDVTEVLAVTVEWREWGVGRLGSIGGMAWIDLIERLRDGKCHRRCKRRLCKIC